MKYYGIRKREKHRAIALKDAETEGLPSPNAIGTLQTGRSHLYKKFSIFRQTRIIRTRFASSDLLL